ncbi:hypothetical protein MGS_03910 [Candida albicans P78042]|nr:hypothetical protein MGK_03896 [Candida albicans P57055]KHC74852.1 hypothetical protein MGS_03910 [Candida albicans P78042]
MKSISFILFTFLLFVAPILGKIQNVYLYVRSQNQTVNGNGLYSVKERPGINYFFLGPPNRAQKLIYDDQNYYIYQRVDPHTRYYFGIQRNILQLSKGNPQRVVMRRNGELNFRGDDKLYAVKNIGDPINYSKDHYAVKYYANKNNVPKHAPKVTVYAKKA